MLWNALLLLTLLPLSLLTVWTLQIKRGAGPQGGEILFLGWIMLFFWLASASAVSAAASTLGGATGIIRFVVLPVAVFIAAAICFVAVSVLLNHASLAEVPAAQSKLEIIGAALVVAGLIAGNVWLLRWR
jgi:hypothetical protein